MIFKHAAFQSGFNLVSKQLVSRYWKDPLAWVAGTAGSCLGTPAEIATNAAAAIAVNDAATTPGSPAAAAAAARRVEKELASANGAVIDVLADAVVGFCASQNEIRLTHRFARRLDFRLFKWLKN